MKNGSLYLFIPLFILFNIPILKALNITLFFSSYLILFSLLVSYIYWHNKHKDNHIFKNILTISAIINFFFFIGWVHEVPVPYTQTLDYCIQYVLEGSLYGGQPYCVQGPIPYIVASMLKFIPLNFEIILKLFYIFSSIIIFYFTFKIKEKETKDNSLFLLAFLFFLFFLKKSDYVTIVGAIFLTGGFYFLFYTNRIILGSSLLSLSLFSKATAIFIVPSIFLFYIINRWKDDRKNKLYLFLKIFIPTIILLIIFTSIYDYFLDYYIIVHQIHPQVQSLTYTIIQFFSFKYIYAGIFLSIYVGLFVVLLRIIHKEFDIFSFIVAISLPLFFLKAAATFGPEHISTHTRYFILFIPFYLTILFKLKKDIKIYKLKITFYLALIFLSILLYQILGGITLSDVTDGSIFNDDKFIRKIGKEISFPLFTLNTTGLILSSNDMPVILGENNSFLYLKKDQFVNKTKYENITYLFEPLDYSFADYLVKLGVVDSLIPYEPYAQYNDSFVIDNLYNNKFSVIILWPYLDYTAHILKDHKTYLNENYCLFFVPFLTDISTKDKESYILIYIRDNNECQKLSNTMIQYYQRESTQICHRSSILLSSIKKVLSKNNISIVKDCKSVTKTGVFYSEVWVQDMYFAFFICMFLFYIAFKK